MSKQHEVYKLIESNLPTSYIEEHEAEVKRKEELFAKMQEIHLDNFKKSLETLPEEKRVLFSEKQWKSDFDYFNRPLLEEADFDESDLVIPHTKEQSARSKENYRSKQPISICIAGRENVGKSSILNKLVKEDRVVVSDVPGTTRDSIAVQWVYKGRRVSLTDTAGIKKSEKDLNRLDKLATDDTMKTIKMSNIVIYVCEAQEGITGVDWKMIELIGREGRGCVLVMNKWDLVSNEFKAKARKYLEEKLRKTCLEFRFKRVLYTSAKNTEKLDTVMDDVLVTYSNWNCRISTSMLNDWMVKAKKTTKTPGRHGDHLNLKFVTQLKVRPPEFVAFVNDRMLFFRSHELFFKSSLAEEFKMHNVPFRLLTRDYDNVRLFKKQSVATSKIKKKVQLQKDRMRTPTAWRKEKGYAKLYRKNSIFPRP